jgi:hypothetical protein
MIANLEKKNATHASTADGIPAFQEGGGGMKVGKLTAAGWLEGNSHAREHLKAKSRGSAESAGGTASQRVPGEGRVGRGSKGRWNNEVKN